MPHWVWVVDTATGHRYDVDKQALHPGRGLEPVNDPRYPDREGPRAQPRRPKHWVGKDGQPAPYEHGKSRFPDQEDIDAARQEAGVDVPASGDEQDAAPTQQVAVDAPASGGEAFVPRSPGRRGKSTPAQTPADDNDRSS